jgi:hypothetical protein
VSDNIEVSLAKDGERLPMGLGMRRSIEKLLYPLSWLFILATCLVETFF